MSPLTIYLAKLFGLYCIIFALAMMAHKREAVEAIQALLRSPPLLLFVEIVGLMGGLALVLGHNIWSGGALPVVVTLLGWLILIRGAALLALPEATKIRLFDALRYEERYHLYMGVALILGIYLTVAGFAA